MQIVVLSSLRNEMLKIVHMNHMGGDKTKTKAGAIFYWPGMSSQAKHDFKL